jgi:hypothetical protein
MDRSQDEAELSAADEQLLRELTERARTGGLKLTGEGGLLGKLTKMVIDGALDDHMGYAKHNPEGATGQFPQRAPRQDGDYRYRAGGNQRTAGSGFQLRELQGPSRRS